MADAERRRRRLRHNPTTSGNGDTPTTSTSAVYDVEPTPHRRATTSEEREGERGLRGLVGSGTSQVGVSAALRARDAARPTDEDLAEAEAQTVIVRRNWVPREELPRSGR